MIIKNILETDEYFIIELKHWLDPNKRKSSQKLQRNNHKTTILKNEPFLTKSRKGKVITSDYLRGLNKPCIKLVQDTEQNDTEVEFYKDTPLTNSRLHIKYCLLNVLKSKKIFAYIKLKPKDQNFDWNNVIHLMMLEFIIAYPNEYVYHCSSGLSYDFEDIEETQKIVWIPKNKPKKVRTPEEELLYHIQKVLCLFEINETTLTKDIVLYWLELVKKYIPTLSVDNLIKQAKNFKDDETHKDALLADIHNFIRGNITPFFFKHVHLNDYIIYNDAKKVDFDVQSCIKAIMKSIAYHKRFLYQFDNKLIKSR